MSYTAPNRLLMPMRHSIDTLMDSWLPDYGPVDSAAAWGTAGLAIYVPLRIPSRVVVLKLWCASGATAAGNVDMALYNAAGGLVVAATGTAKGGSMELVFDVTDTPVGPGLYYVALSSDSTTASFVGYLPAAPLPLAYGVLTEAAAYPLPATATFAASQSLTFIPAMGVLIGTTVS
jgi:hypothetical protein